MGRNEAGGSWAAGKRVQPMESLKNSKHSDYKKILWEDSIWVKAVTQGLRNGVCLVVCCTQKVSMAGVACGTIHSGQNRNLVKAKDGCEATVRMLAFHEWAGKVLDQRHILIYLALERDNSGCYFETPQEKGRCVLVRVEARDSLIISIISVNGWWLGSEKEKSLFFYPHCF